MYNPTSGPYIVIVLPMTAMTWPQPLLQLLLRGQLQKGQRLRRQPVLHQIQGHQLVAPQGPAGQGQELTKVPRQRGQPEVYDCTMDNMYTYSILDQYVYSVNTNIIMSIKYIYTAKNESCNQDVPFSTPYFCVGVFTQSLSRHCEVFGMGVESPGSKTNCSKTERDISNKTLHFLESDISEHSANPPIRRWACLKVFIYDLSSVVI